MNTDTGKDRGIYYDRINHNPIEKAFADLWESENAPGRNVNYGHGILQDLFMKNTPMSRKISPRLAEPAIVITDEHRYIVATVIQWLGSNCGQSFLHEALGNSGLTITSKKDS